MALVVLGVGLISIAKLQPTVLENSSLARARAVAVQLAEQKIEDLRTYSTLSAANASSPWSYQNIASSSDSIPASSGSNVAYDRSWTVTKWVFPITNNSAAIQSTAATLPDYKLVKVTVSWTDQNAVAQSVPLGTIITGADPLRSGLVVEQ